MKSIKFASLLTVLALALMLTSCGPSYVGVNAGYPRPYYGYGYVPYGYYRPYYRPPVVVSPRVVRPRYYSPAPRYYGGSPNARGGFNGGGYRGGSRSRGPR
jgi:hypothetical protein